MRRRGATVTVSTTVCVYTIVSCFSTIGVYGRCRRISYVMRLSSFVPKE